MNDYIAWLDNHSVARGTLASCKAKALEVFHSEDFQRFANPTTTIRITRGSRQLFVTSYLLDKVAA